GFVTPGTDRTTRRAGSGVGPDLDSITRFTRHPSPDFKVPQGVRGDGIADPHEVDGPGHLPHITEHAAEADGVIHPRLNLITQPLGVLLPRTAERALGTFMNTLHQNTDRAVPRRGKMFIQDGKHRVIFLPRQGTIRSGQLPPDEVT